ncbi:MAG: hypothetical protein UX31_C0003G0036 [Candidatus Nomurabacteria bacterium GW2011_GWA1_46_11]|uniref:Lipoprotein n=1 Tax=Candidatus Nomurabacteria bacterium GW2011_GWA1_46_11 TaxID=1618732 RepID=A0A0G1RN67_9BACT|nr:MAG: hypothetical protein UW69_C0026G0013 [Microgenomates group bacterium GW2011_GWA2_44_7]KKT78312.1 MAG: hypothetical protein UW73_C0004G0036 [Microgenomates group bacterium GW2011_GWB1_44_8]KKU22370.1 MAG: hypothetical protein UX31_C0003G0036 [Candidatus Nomurabacteria bacterium GW2011_GWA1_46_11]
MNKGLLIGGSILLIVVVAAVVWGNQPSKSGLSDASTLPTPATIDTSISNFPAINGPASSPEMIATQEVVTIRESPQKGQYLADEKGMTLYLFDKDTDGVSTCTGNCLKIWPPYLQTEDTLATLPDMVDVIERPDGSMQYTYNDMPLYYYASDKKPGDVLGDGVNGVWHLVTPLNEQE